MNTLHIKTGDTAVVLSGKEKGKKDTDNAAYIDEILSSFSESEISDSVLQIIKGDKTLEEVLTKGECDLI